MSLGSTTILVGAAAGNASFQLTDGQIITDANLPSGVAAFFLTRKLPESRKNEVGRYRSLFAYFASSAANNATIDYRVYGAYPIPEGGKIRQFATGTLTVGNTSATSEFGSGRLVDQITVTDSTWLTNARDAVGVSTASQVFSPASDGEAWLMIGDALNAYSLLFEFETSDSVTPAFLGLT